MQNNACKKSTELHTLKLNIYVAYSYKNENIKFSKKAFPQSRNIGKRNNLKLWEQYIKGSKHDSQIWL